VALVAAAAQAYAWVSYRSSFDAGMSLPARLAAARRAQALAPYATDYRVRVLWLRGETALAEGDLRIAVGFLERAYKNDVGNTELLAVFKEAQRRQLVQDSRKAHVQHGKEGPGGTLRPEDVQH
jgi:hypothetical protein